MSTQTVIVVAQQASENMILMFEGSGKRFTIEIEPANVLPLMTAMLHAYTAAVRDKKIPVATRTVTGGKITVNDD